MDLNSPWLVGVAASGTKDGTPSLLTTPSTTDTSVNRISTKNLKRLSRSDSSPSGKYHLPFRIQLFRERLSEKVHETIPKGIVGGFESTVPQRNLKE